MDSPGLSNCRAGSSPGGRRPNRSAICDGVHQRHAASGAIHYYCRIHRHSRRNGQHHRRLRPPSSVSGERPSEHHQPLMTSTILLRLAKLPMVYPGRTARRGTFRTMNGGLSERLKRTQACRSRQRSVTGNQRGLCWRRNCIGCASICAQQQRPIRVPGWHRPTQPNRQRPCRVSPSRRRLIRRLLLVGE